MPSTRIVIVDGQGLQREGVAAILRRHEPFEIVGTYTSAEDLLAEIEEIQPNVVVLDERLPGIPGALACERIHERMPAVITVILSDPPARADIAASLVAGADRVVSRLASARELARAVRAAMHPAGSCRATCDPLLSARQLAVIRFLSQGFTTGQTAKRLQISVSTAKADLRRSIERLGAADRSQAVAEATRQGLI